MRAVRAVLLVVCCALATPVHALAVAKAPRDVDELRARVARARSPTK